MTNPFTLLKADERARLGSFLTPHGRFQTPNFMVVGTKASVKGVDTPRLKSLGSQITLVNTFHLWQRPGEELVHKMGGIHKFMGWDGPILSDSGGFQVFSLEKLRKIEEDGVRFRSPVDGKELFLSPEVSVQIQEKLGVDIAMGFDECPPSTLSYDDTARSLDRTHRWLKRSVEAKTRTDMSLFGITQGALFSDLRKASAEYLSTLPFDGYAVGGLSVGETQDEMYEVLSHHPEELPAERIRYLMGVGTPEDLIEAVWSGIDLFDCVMPTRSGRFGRVFVSGEEPYLNIKNARFREDPLPLDEECDCLTCTNYSRSYLHYLFRAEEMLAPQLLSIHNIRYYMNWFETMRRAIGAGRLTALRDGERARWGNFREVIKNEEGS